ncbi:DUF3300 domain-containing protein [Ensifer psoraleae]|uniref:DUF3300 domain-containing protein n=2 Tax=Sinorhizobium psoraleae TaxID=520838 RepID=A0ABT4KQX9_9HYPH|nr:DUF3300 domain-containing protein [Sinorhizobium psoraleae]MCZ4094273.1 DUF3300 domain-containing protein [Sinorhizobium psoraleae]
MIKSILRGMTALAAISLLPIGGDPLTLTKALAQQMAAVPAQEQAEPEPLTEQELEILVARIALYPDELVALISAASLYPLQIVEAERFLQARAKNPDLQPKEDWDGSVISLLNYPQIVGMMSDDLDWTQQLGQAIAYQQKDVLIAIQQLREEAVAKGVIKSDDKVKVVEDNDNIVIQSASPEKIYVPQYPPEMLYEPDYAPVPIGYYPEPYPAYYYPAATFFAGAVTGAIWAAVVDWDDWGVWGGRWDGDINVDCNKCFNNVDINGKIKWNDIDWKNVDRSKLSFDRDQFQKFDRTNIRNNIKANSDNSIRNRAAELKRDRPAQRPAGGQLKDVRKSTLEGLQARPGPETRPRPNIESPAAARRDVAQPGINRSTAKRPAKIDRPVGKPKAAAKLDSRPRKPSALGNVSHGKRETLASQRGGHSMGGGHSGGGRPHKVIKRGAGRRH